jgi:hypothetical protein
METKSVKILNCEFSLDNPTCPIVIVGDDKVFGTEEFKKYLHNPSMFFCDDFYDRDEEFAKRFDAVIEKLAEGHDATLNIDGVECWEFTYGKMDLLQ